MRSDARLQSEEGGTHIGKEEEAKGKMKEYTKGKKNKEAEGERTMAAAAAATAACSPSGSTKRLTQITG